MDLRKLKTLIDLVAESGISEIEVTEGEDKVRIVKNSPVPMATPMHVYSQPMQLGTMPPAAPAPAACTPSTTGGQITPPMKVRDVRPRYRKEWVGGLRLLSHAHSAHRHHQRRDHPSHSSPSRFSLSLFGLRWASRCTRTACTCCTPCT